MTTTEAEERAMVSVPLEDLQRFVEHARWTPPMLDTLSADEYRKTLEAEIALRQIIARALRERLDRRQAVIRQPELMPFTGGW